jgi:hypothetical protein
LPLIRSSNAVTAARLNFKFAEIMELKAETPWGKPIMAVEEVGDGSEDGVAADKVPANSLQAKEVRPESL